MTETQTMTTQVAYIRVMNKLMKMARIPKFNNGEAFKAEHAKFLMFVITILTAIIIGFFKLTYENYINYQDEVNRKQDEQRKEFYNELLEKCNNSTISTDAIKKYILLRDGVDLDAVIEQHTWEQLHEKFKSNTRGHSIDFVEPDVDYSNLAVEH